MPHPLRAVFKSNDSSLGRIKKKMNYIIYIIVVKAFKTTIDWTRNKYNFHCNLICNVPVCLLKALNTLAIIYKNGMTYYQLNKM